VKFGIGVIINPNVELRACEVGLSKRGSLFGLIVLKLAHWKKYKQTVPTA
jgi:hypothetical protein